MVDESKGAPAIEGGYENEEYVVANDGRYTAYDKGTKNSRGEKKGVSPGECATEWISRGGIEPGQRE